MKTKHYVTAIKPNAEKMKCIKNAKTGKVQRLPKSVAEQTIADNPDWHFTTKSAYEKVLLNEIPKGKAFHPTRVRPIDHKHKDKGLRKDVVEKQVIITTTPIENKDVEPSKLVVTKPRKKVPYVSTINEVLPNSGKVVEDTSTTIMVKVPDTEAEPKVIGQTTPKNLITKIKYVWHLIVDGKRVQPLIKNL